MSNVSVKLPVHVWELVAYALLSYAAQRQTADQFWEKIAKNILRQLNEQEPAKNGRNGYVVNS